MQACCPDGRRRRWQLDGWANSNSCFRDWNWTGRRHYRGVLLQYRGFSHFWVSEMGEGRSVDLKTCVPRINESGEETLCGTLMSFTREAAVCNSVGEPHPKSWLSLWNETVPFCWPQRQKYRIWVSGTGKRGMNFSVLSLQAKSLPR